MKTLRAIVLIQILRV